LSHCGDVGMVGKYPNKYQSNPNYITLPQFGGLERLHSTHMAAMMPEVILCQSFCECISNQVFGVDGEDLDKPFLHVFMKMMIANIYVLGPWA
jgi:hypothetical protein